MRIYLNDVLMDQVEMNKDEMTIGRSADSDIVLDNAGVSSHHAWIQKETGGYVIDDNDSSNGVFVNGNKIDQHRLEYRDEIQIYNYVLKYMASRGLHGIADPDIAQDGDQSQTGTMEVNISDVQELLKLREKKKTAYVEVLDAKGNQSRFLLKEQNFKIGKSKDCDIRTSGWLSFGVAAEIQRDTDGYRLLPQRRGRVMRNEEPLTQPVKLMDGDSLRVNNLSMRFFHRVINNQ
ncbi:MAG: FHA domain-containing protein [Gammaproteobacteria bacterium]|nr:FHA domain-containing protein [Gammaproteobacteria bacterium]